MKKITLRNIRKFFYYVFTGEFDTIMSVWEHGRIKKRKPEIVKWIKKNACKTSLFTEVKYEETIDIIVPVYNGFEYLEALFTSIKQTKMDYNMIIVDDCSPDELVKKYLSNLATGNPKIKLIANEKNLGFVQSVNIAFAHAKNHIALLNSDVELPPYWLERLMHPILRENNIASSTPFTNSGTICSFPLIGEDNPLFESLTCEEIDSAFRHITPAYTPIPTGVGFCMGINKNVLDKIGIFDAETFARGFGEENDWCQRAKKAGYENVIIENLFVYHKHRGSFTSEEKEVLTKQNTELLLKKHPKYNILVTKFFKRDPIKLTREFAVLYLLSKFKAKKHLLVFNHSYGGGATDYIDSKIQEALNAGNGVTYIYYDLKSWLFVLEYKYKDYELKYNFEKIEELQHLLKHTACHEVIVNELVSYPKIYDLLTFIIGIKNEYNAKLTFNVHDYFSVCPTVNLIGQTQEYCRLPEGDICEKCFKKTFNDGVFESITTWHKNWKEFIQKCDEIIAFSDSTRDILESIYGRINELKVIPHKVEYIINPGKRYKTTDTLNIGLIGIATVNKGQKIIKKMLKIIKQEQMNVNIILIGSSEKQIKHKNFRETGRYNREALPFLTLQNDIDIFFIPSIVPETFSFTTEEAMQMDMPVAVFDIGAPPERVRKYKKGLVIDTIDAKAALSQIVSYITVQKSPFFGECVMFVGEYISFSSRYRVEHFREQLVIQGVQSDYVDSKTLGKVDFSKYTTAVIYRCRYTPKIAAMIKDFQNQGKKVFYDIDDFIFDYNEIKNLTFMSDEEYKDFEQYSSGINKCMSLCDGFITSTENMKTAIYKAFPNVPVIVNRNVASIEMASLSYSAMSNMTRKDNKITMGYFSGSKTHNSDFEIISDTLLSLFKKYDNLHLKIVGCLDIPDNLKACSDRIECMEFVDWRELPALIATIDINLMPVEDTFFHRCKSENKWMEAALVAVPTVSSYNDELEHVIKDGFNGYLCKNEKEWEKALELLIEKPDIRDSIGKAAKAAVFEGYITTVSGKPAVDAVLYNKK